MKKSTAVAAVAGGGVAAAIGLAAVGIGVLCIPVGLAAGAYFAGAAVLGIGAGMPLAVLAGIGGAIVGSWAGRFAGVIAANVGVVAGVGVGAVVGGVTKLAGGAFEKVFSRKKGSSDIAASAPVQAVREPASDFKVSSIGIKFGNAAIVKSINSNNNKLIYQFSILKI